MAAQVQAMTIKVPHLLSVFFFFVKNELRFKIVICLWLFTSWETVL